MRTGQPRPWRRVGLGALALAVLLAVPAVAAPASTPTPEQIKQVAADLVCLCGDCNRESLATCICGIFAIPEREAIGRLLAEGRSRQEIVDSYVARFGSQVLANPPKGYDVVWIVPFVVLVAGAIGVRQILVHWRRHRSAQGSLPAVAAAVGAPRPEDDYQERLRQELDRFEG